MEEEKVFGKCDICGVVGRTERNFICQDCGDPLKIILTCTKCHFRMDLTQEDPKILESMFGRHIPFGTAIAAPWCFDCTSHPEERKGKALLYRVRPPAKA
jgi:hypothetical protein